MGLRFRPPAHVVPLLEQARSGRVDADGRGPTPPHRPGRGLGQSARRPRQPQFAPHSGLLREPPGTGADATLERRTRPRSGLRAVAAIRRAVPGRFQPAPEFRPHQRAARHRRSRLRAGGAAAGRNHPGRQPRPAHRGRRPALGHHAGAESGRPRRGPEHAGLQPHAGESLPGQLGEGFGSVARTGLAADAAQRGHRPGFFTKKLHSALASLAGKRGGYPRGRVGSVQQNTPRRGPALDGRQPPTLATSGLGLVPLEPRRRLRPPRQRPNRRGLRGFSRPETGSEDVGVVKAVLREVE